ncbi:hypothetical protein [Delftia tsuruhatensis]|jgi:hypothetical protein|uniref:hypothetical protein n=1 Tax=Delftia tsuruhatensis TaxID=180282 RepID=UPI0030CD27AF
MSDTYTHEERLAARVSMHEFLLEQLFANRFLQGAEPEASWETFSNGFIEKMKTPWSRESITTEEQKQIFERQRALGVELAERFAEKVAQRIARP